MFRGTTPTLYFKINNIEDLSTIKELNITFKTQSHKCCKHNDGRKMVKTLEDVVIDEDNHIISLDLSQQDTLSLQSPLALVQIKFMFTDDKVCASTICEIPVEDPLDDRIMRLELPKPEKPDDGGDEPENPDTPVDPENPDDPSAGDDTPTDPDEGGDGDDIPSAGDEGDESTNPENPDDSTDPDTPEPTDPDVPENPDETQDPDDTTGEENP